MPLDNASAAVITAAEETLCTPVTGLAQTAMKILERTFAARQHCPGPATTVALRDILVTLDGMANATLAPAIYLASADPGTGKSSSVTAFAQALTASAEHRDVGMVVCVGRLDEARALLLDFQEAGIGHLSAAQTSDEDVNALSGCPAADAQVLVVTQQKVERETRRRSFNDIALFRYRGAVRAVRVWDEAWLPGTPITLDRAELGSLFAVAQKLNGKLYEALAGLFTALGTVEDGGLAEVPDWTALTGIGELEMLDALDNGRNAQAERQRFLTSALYFLSGRSIRVRREAYSQDGAGKVVISYEDRPPEALAPLVVLDASIRVRQTYADAVAHRGVRLLRQAVKDYSPLAVHLWKTAGSKTAWRSNGVELVSGMIATIMTKPSEDWLVVAHKASGKVGDVAAQLRKALPPSVADRVSVITWGCHMATNAYRDVGNVILAGTLFMPAAHYLALTHMAKGQPAEAHGFADAEAVRRTTYGEHRNLILQAACRGRVRQSDGDRCRPMDLYIIASASSAIPTHENVQTIFPGALVRRWAPLPVGLTGKALEASVILARLLEDGTLRRGNGFLGYAQIAARMTGKAGEAQPMDMKNFMSRVAAKEEWKAHLVREGLAEVDRPRVGRRPERGLTLAAPDTAAVWSDTE